jgi:hypothetical protein
MQTAWREQQIDAELSAGGLSSIRDESRQLKAIGIEINQQDSQRNVSYKQATP